MIPPFSLKTKIATPRLEETRDWYCDLFGMDVLEEWDEPDDRGCILALRLGTGEASLEIYQGEPASDYTALSLQFRVGDVDLFSPPSGSRFAFAGPVDRPWGSRYLFFTDPNGISVIVFSGPSF